MPYFDQQKAMSYPSYFDQQKAMSYPFMFSGYFMAY